jgi:hypothetical protein
VACGGDEENGGVGDGWLFACGKIVEKVGFLYFFVDKGLKMWDDKVSLGLLERPMKSIMRWKNKGNE